MTRILLAASIFALIASATEPSKVVHSARPFSPDMPIPVVDHGWLMFLGFDEPTLYVQRPDGTPAYTVTIQMPGGVRPSLHDASVDSRDRVAIAVAYPGGETGAEGAIILLNSSGKQDGLYSTGRYIPYHLCFDPDGNIWTTGWQRDFVKRDMEDEQDYAVVRRFNAKVEETGAFVNRSTLPRPGHTPGTTAIGRWGIRSSRDHIGAHLIAGERTLWIELDRDGKEVGRWTLDREQNGGFAFAGGELYSVVSRKRDEATWISNFVKLDRATGHWQLIEELKDPFAVMDADSDQLVVAQDHGRIYRWIKP